MFRFTFFLLFLYLATLCSVASANPKKPEDSAREKVQAAITDLCSALLGTKDRRAFQPVREDPPELVVAQRWSEFSDLLSASRARRFASSYDRDGVESSALKAVSWMLPNDSRRFPRPAFVPKQAGGRAPLTFEEHMRQVKHLQSFVQNPDWGLFGPNSVFWRVVGFAGDMFNIGAVNSIQLAHPVGAQGVYEHSQLLKNPIERMKQTARYIYQVVFDPWDQVHKVAIGIFKGHSRVTGVLPESVGAYRAGQSYSALDPEALMWVYATRVMAWLEAYDVLSGRPLDKFEREQFYQESKLFAIVFGIPLDFLPKDFAGFYDYYQYMLSSDRLAVGRTASTIQEHFQAKVDAMLKGVVGVELVTGSLWAVGPTMLIHNALKSGSENMSAFYMPDWMQDGFGYRYSKSQQELTAKINRKIFADFFEPRGLLVLPAYQIAMARVRGEAVPEKVLKRHYMVTGEKRGNR